MAITLTYGAYNFVSAGPVPQVGIDTRYERPGDSGPAYATRIVTVSGYFATFNDYATNQGAVDALRTALKQDNQTLVFNDGTHSIINHTARVVSLSAPVEWGQHVVNYEAVFEYKLLDVTHNITLTTTIGAFTFTPPPNVGRRYENSAAVTKCKVTIQGFFQKGTIALNQAEIDSLKAIVAATGGVALVYDGISETVRNVTIDAPANWTADTLPYTLTCEYDTARSGLLGASVQLGSYTFTLPPAIGRRYRNAEHRRVCEVSLSGYIDAGSIANNQAQLELIRNVCDDTKATLVYGSFSQSVRKMRVDAPSEWSEILLPYVITCEYTAARAAVTESCSLCGFSFPQLPSLGRRVSWKRKSDQADPTMTTVEIVLSGKFEGDGVNANVTLVDSLLTACASGTGTLVYGSQISETVRIVSIDTPSEWLEDEAPFTVVCEYDESLVGGDIIDFATQRQISEVYQRTAFHEIPYTNGRITQSLGLSHFTITFTGYFICNSLANALTAYRAEVATRPAGGILMPGSTRTEDEDACKVEYSDTYSYNAAATVAAQVSIR